MAHGAGELLQGRYELRGVLAHGPTTVTYTAFDRTANRRVGVRHWSSDSVGPAQAAAELARALELGERITHVHLPRYSERFSLAATRGTDQYLVHDAYEGQTLAQWTQAAKRPESELRGMALSLLRAIEVLHRNQFVHGAVCADEVLVRGDGRLFLMGCASVNQTEGGVPGDLRACGETLSVATSTGLSPGFRGWLQRLLASDGTRGFVSASEAIRVLQATPSTRGPNPYIGPLLGLAVIGGVAFAGYHYWARIHPMVAADHTPPAGATLDLGKPITDTSFTPKPIDGAAGLRLSSLHSLTGHHGSVNDLVFDATGTRIASGSDDNTVRIWNAEEGRQLNEFYHAGKVNAVAFMGSAHVVGAAGGTVRVWDAPSGQLQQQIAADSKRVSGVCTAHAGRNIVTVGLDGTVHVFDSETGKSLRVMQQSPKAYALAVDANGERIATGGNDGVVHVFRFSDGQEEAELHGHKKAITALTFLADGQSLASGSVDSTVRVWDLNTKTSLLVLEGHRSDVWALASDPSGKELASGSKDGEVRIWNPTTGTLELSEQVDGRGVIGLAFSPDGQRLAVGGGSDRVDVYALVVQRPSWRPPPVTQPRAPSAPVAQAEDTSAAHPLIVKARALIENGGAHPLIEARALLRQALVVDPKSYEAFLELGHVDLAQNAYDDALQDAQRCEKQKAGDARTQMLFIEVAAAQKQDDQLTQRAHALIDSNPDAATLSALYATLRKVYLRRGENAAAEETLRSEINLDPASAQLKGELAALLVQHDRFDEAIGWARAAMVQQDYPEVHVTLGNAFAGNAHAALERGDRGQYTLWLERAFAADKRSAEGHYVRALAYRRDHNDEAAFSELRAALASNPHHIQAAAMMR